MIAKIYKWFWKDVLMRREPFTYQFRRMAKAHPILWWSGIGSFTVFWGWFILHIIGIL